MPIKMRWLDYEFGNTDGAPMRPGVFELADQNLTAVQMGAATEVGEAILRVLRATGSRSKARYMRWEEAKDPQARLKELLDEFAAAHNGQLPEGNRTANA